MTPLLNFISVASAFIFGVGSLYWLMDITLGKLRLLHSNKDWHGMQYKDFVFLLIAALILINVFSFYKPH